MVSFDDFKPPSSVISLSSLLYQNVIVFVACIGLLSLFCLLRPNNGAVYQRRRKLADESKTFPKLPPDLFSWIFVVWRTSEEEILQKCGLDAVMLLRLVRLGISYALCMVPFGLALVGVNYHAEKDLESHSQSNGFNLQRLTITNVEKQSFIWVHIAFSWVSFFIIGAWLYKNNHDFLRLRKAYFSSEEYQSDLSSRTLFFYHLPSRCQTPTGLNEFLSGLPYKLQSTHVSLARSVGHLPELIWEFNYLVRNLERSISSFVDKEGRVIGPRPTHKLYTSLFSPLGKKVDSIDFYSNKIQELFYEIKEVKNYVGNLPPIQAGFATFESAYVAHAVVQALLPGVGGIMKGYKPLPEVRLAPKSGDIIWSNLNMSRREVKWRSIIFTGIFLVVLIGGAFPLALLGMFATVDGFRELFGKNMVLGGLSKALIEGFLSPLLMILSMVMVRLLLRKLSINQSAMTHSLVDRRLLAKYYTFLLFNHLIVFSALQTYPVARNAIRLLKPKGIGELLFEIKGLIPRLGVPFTKVIIQSSSFWINQMVLRTTGYFFELIQVVTLTRRFLQKHFVRLSPRDLSEATLPQPFEYPVAYALQCFNITILLLFGIASPLIIPFCLFNLFVSFFVYKHQIMFVYQSKVETGGRLWITAFNHLLSAIILSQFFLLLVFLLSDIKDEQWRVILPLPFLTVVVALSHQSWLLSKYEYIDWREKNAHQSPDKPLNASFERDFHHAVFEQELLGLELSRTVLSAVPEVSRLNTLLSSIHAANQSKSGVSMYKRSSPSSSREFDGTLNDSCSESGSLIELLDRNVDQSNRLRY
ncbi:hypothetical protein DSO57_1032243 [Entomophthora muscae]|uniref:Uncharacterized protein n=1 Tax=Entomophthora muscae TaxID=34485 RepID=A0ACC2RF42_9FUNG|nr:hypothetical protein DSO57_1032243 [Entomophthora muscae]